MTKIKGFSLIELMVVIVVLAYLAWSAAGIQQRKQEVDNYVMSVENDAHVLDMLASALEKFANLQSGMADGATMSNILNRNDFKELLPGGFVTTELPSGMPIRAFIVNGETYTGSGEYVKRAIIVPIVP